MYEALLCDWIVTTTKSKEETNKTEDEKENEDNSNKEETNKIEDQKENEDNNNKEEEKSEESKIASVSVGLPLGEGGPHRGG